MNIKKTFIKVISLLLMTLMVALIPVTTIKAWGTSYDFDVTLKAGYSDKLYVGYGAPFYITVENKSNANFDGVLQMIVPNYEDNNIMYEQEFSIGAGEKKSVEFDAGLLVPSREINVRLANKKGKVLWSEIQDIDFSKTMDEVRVGILSDDFTALAYMDRQHFLSNSDKYTSLVELDKDLLSVDYQAMETIDVIVISDYSTDLLTKEQIGALNMWIQNGGFLLVGTGSTANKTLSGLNGQIFTANLQSKGDVVTTLGQADRDRSYIGIISSTTSNNRSRNKILDEIFLYSGSVLTINDYPYYNYDYDGDGYSDMIFDNYQPYTDNNGNLWDTYNQMIDEDYHYLFEEDAYETDPSGVKSYYKYYDQRYCVVPDNDPDFEDFFSAIKTDDYLISVAYEEYCNVWKMDPKFFIYESAGFTTQSDVDFAFEEMLGDDFYNFYRHWGYGCYLYTTYNIDPFVDLTNPSFANINTTYAYITVDMAQYDVMGTEYGISGDDKNGDAFDIVKVVPRGNGYIGIASIDFTKNPIPKTAYSGEFFRDLVERVIGADFILKSDDYNSDMSNSSYYYHKYNNNRKDLEKLYNTVSSAPLPPFLLYGVLILGYFIAIMVVYIVSSAKQKTYSLWTVFPIMMVVISVAIFSFGFSTRVLRLNINTITLIKPENGISYEQDFISATVPKKKTYEVNFSNEVTVKKSFTVNDYYRSYYINDDHNLDRYTTVYRENYDGIQGIISNKVALDSQYFMAEAVYPTQGGLEVEFINDPAIAGIKASNIKLTNNYATDLEDIVVVMFDQNNRMMDFYIKSIKAGESKTAISGNNYTQGTFVYASSYNSYSVPSRYTTFRTDAVINGIMFGEISKKTRNYLKRKNTIQYIMEEEAETDNNHLIVIAFPKTTIGAKIADQKNCKSNRYEVIFLNPEYSVMDYRFHEKFGN